MKLNIFSDVQSSYEDKSKLILIEILYLSYQTGKNSKAWYALFLGCGKQTLSYIVGRNAKGYECKTLTESNLAPANAMAPHSSTLAWRIPWMEEPGGLQSMRLLGVGHD